MRKCLVVALALVGVTVIAHGASAKSSCVERRDACYAKVGQTVSKVAAGRCDAEYNHCKADLSAEPGNTIVSAVPGLGTPMMGPNPTVPVAANPASPSSSSAQIASTRAANARRIVPKVKK